MIKSTFSNRVINSLFFLFLTITINAQLQNANWYLGKGAGLNFNDGTQPVTALTNGALSTAGGCATVSDANGELLFYTDSKFIWTKTHEPMKGSGLLFGSQDVSQNVVIVPSPIDANEYYIFTNEGFRLGSHGLNYTVVDMTLQNGMGSVDEYQLNEPLLEYSSEKLTTVFNPDDGSYWIIAFAPSSDPTHSDTFYSFKLIEDYIILSNQSTFSFLPEVVDYPGGQMKISPDGTTLAMVHNTVDEKGPSSGVENVFSFDFNMLTGAVTSKNTYALDNTLYCYGLEFSPDSDKFFVSSTHRKSDEASEGFIHQIWYRNAPVLYIPEQIIGFSEEPIYSLQLGIDGNIYGTSLASSGLHCFGNPNGLCQEVCFDANAIDLNGRYSFKGLPQLVPQQVLTNSLITDSKIYTIQENPFEEVLLIKFHIKEKFKLNLYTSSGNKVKAKNFDILNEDQIIEIDCVKLIDGLYQLIITDDRNDIDYIETVLKVGGATGT